MAIERFLDLTLDGAPEDKFVRTMALRWIHMRQQRDNAQSRNARYRELLTQGGKTIAKMHRTIQTLKRLVPPKKSRQTYPPYELIK